jgi:hypothetical protein
VNRSDQAKVDHGMVTLGVLRAQVCWERGGRAAAAAAPNLAALAVLARDYSTVAAHAQVALSVRSPPPAARVAAAAVALQVLPFSQTDLRTHWGHASSR